MRRIAVCYSIPHKLNNILGSLKLPLHAGEPHTGMDKWGENR